MNRHDPTPQGATCMMRIRRGNVWYDMRPLHADGCFITVEYVKRVIERLRRKGRTVRVIWLSGMGLGLGE